MKHSVATFEIPNVGWDIGAIAFGKEMVAPLDVTMASWAQFRALVVSTGPLHEAEVPASRQKLKANLALLSGVKVPDDVQVDIFYSGDERNGFCEPQGVVDGERKLLGQALKYDESVQGFLNAIFFAAALPRLWSRWHGLAGRDYTLLASGAALADILKGVRAPNPSEEHWPPVGIRIRKKADVFVVACLAYQTGYGLYDLSVELRDGRASSLQFQEVFIWDGGVFY